MTERPAGQREEEIRAAYEIFNRCSESGHGRHHRNGGVYCRRLCAKCLAAALAALREQNQDLKADVDNLHAIDEQHCIEANRLREQVRAAERECQRLRHEHNVMKPADDPACCTGCGGQYAFDTTLPSVTWNRVIRAAGLPEFLCAACIVRAFAKAGEGFTAVLWGEDFDGVPVEFSINGRTANSHAEMSEENTRLRAHADALAEENRALRAQVAPR